MGFYVSSSLGSSDGCSSADSCSRHTKVGSSITFTVETCAACDVSLCLFLQVVEPPVGETDRIDRYDVDKELASLSLVVGQPRMVQYHGYSTGYEFEEGERVLKGCMMTE